jgi:hypothetical protein
VTPIALRCSKQRHGYNTDTETVSSAWSRRVVLDRLKLTAALAVNCSEVAKMAGPSNAKAAGRTRKFRVSGERLRRGVRKFPLTRRGRRWHGGFRSTGSQIYTRRKEMAQCFETPSNVLKVGTARASPRLRIRRLYWLNFDGFAWENDIPCYSA